MNSEGLVKLERVRVTCPACGELLEAVARDGRVKGYCAIGRQRVDFLVEEQRIQGHIGKNPTAETRAKISTSVKKRWQDGVVSDYVRGDKISVIQLEYGISPGALYRVLRAANVRLRTDEGDASDGGGIKCPKEV